MLCQIFSMGRVRSYRSESMVCKLVFTHVCMPNAVQPFKFYLVVTILSSAMFALFTVHHLQVCIQRDVQQLWSGAC